MKHSTKQYANCPDGHNLEIWTVWECFCLELISTSLHQLFVVPVASFGQFRLIKVGCSGSWHQRWQANPERSMPWHAWNRSLRWWVHAENNAAWNVLERYGTILNDCNLVERYHPPRTYILIFIASEVSYLLLQWKLSKTYWLTYALCNHSFRRSFLQLSSFITRWASGCRGGCGVVTWCIPIALQNCSCMIGKMITASDKQPLKSIWINCTWKNELFQQKCLLAIETLGAWC